MSVDIYTLCHLPTCDDCVAGEPIGIITIEDVLEELMGQEILDETDTFADNECTVPVNEEMRVQVGQYIHVYMAIYILSSPVSNVMRECSEYYMRDECDVMCSTTGMHLDCSSRVLMRHLACSLHSACQSPSGRLSWAVHQMKQYGG